MPSASRSGSVPRHLWNNAERQAEKNEWKRFNGSLKSSGHLDYYAQLGKDQKAKFRKAGCREVGCMSRIHGL